MSHCRWQSLSKKTWRGAWKTAPTSSAFGVGIKRGGTRATTGATESRCFDRKGRSVAMTLVF